MLHDNPHFEYPFKNKDLCRPHPHPHPHPRPKSDPLTRETTKVAELKDRFGHTKFKIILNNFEDGEYPLVSNDVYPPDPDQRPWDSFKFQVSVVSFADPSSEEQYILYADGFEDYDEALSKYNELVEQYRLLINVKTKGWQDITAYADKINYRKIDPDCCKNCIWAKPVPYRQQLFQDWKHHKSHLVCMNPKIVDAIDDFVPHEPDHVKDPRHPHDDSRHRNDDHFYHEERKHFNFDLCPYTHDDGICDDYRRNP